MKLTKETVTFYETADKGTGTFFMKLTEKTGIRILPGYPLLLNPEPGIQ